MRITRGALIIVIFSGGMATSLASPEVGSPSANVVGAAAKGRFSDKEPAIGQRQLQRPDMHLAFSGIKRTAPSRIKGGDLFDPRSWSTSLSASPRDLPHLRQTQIQMRQQGQAQPQGPLQQQGQPGQQGQPQQQGASQAVPVEPVPSFAFVGRLIDGKDVSLFLTRNGHAYLAKVNDVLDDAYRVDKITDVDATLTYLPTNSQQKVTFNSTAVGSSALAGTASADSLPVSAPVAEQPPAATVTAQQRLPVAATLDRDAKPQIVPAQVPQK